jgi:hypothetical protein
MSDYLDFLLQRSASEQPLIRPRLPSVFEPQVDFTSPELPSADLGTGEIREEVMSKAGSAGGPAPRGLRGSESGEAVNEDLFKPRFGSREVGDRLAAPRRSLTAQVIPRLERVDPLAKLPGEEQPGYISGTYVQDKPAQPAVHPAASDVTRELIREPLIPEEPPRIVEGRTHPHEPPFGPLATPTAPFAPLAPLPPPQRLGQASDSRDVAAPQPAPSITVRIGRIEILAARPAVSAPARKLPPVQRKPVMSLDSYLAQRRKEKP